MGSWHSLRDGVRGILSPGRRESQGMAAPHSGQPHASFQNKSSSVCRRIRVCAVSRKQLIHLLFHLRIWMMRKWLAGLQQEQETPSSAHCNVGKRLGGHLQPPEPPAFRPGISRGCCLHPQGFGIQMEENSALGMPNHSCV